MKAPTLQPPTAAATHAVVENASFLRGAAYLVLTALTLSPLLWVAVPPLVDYPNHLARMWILVQDGKVTELANNYVIHWRLVPNLAMDLVIPALSHFMPVEVAGRVFIALTMLALFGGTLALHRALHNCVGIWPICSLLFIYNAALYWGFLNFLFGLGMFLLAFGAWIATRDWNAVRRLSLFSLAAAALIVLHLFAFGLYGLCVMSYEFGRRLQGWRLSRAALISLCGIATQFLPAALLWGMSLSNSGPMFTAYGSLRDKQYAISAPWDFGGGLLILDTLTKDICAGFLIFAIVTRSIKLVPEMRWPLAAMAVAALAMPNWLSGSWSADIRLPIALPFVIIASTQLQAPWRRTIGVFAVSAAMLLGARVWSVTESWRSYDQQFTEFRTAARAISPGSRLLIVETFPIPEDATAVADLPQEFARRYVQNYWHLPALAVIDRSAFIPYLFTGWTPVQPHPRNAGLFQTQSTPLTPEELNESVASNRPEAYWATPNFLGEVPYWREWPKTFDYVLSIDFGHPPDKPLDILRPVSKGSFFRIYRIAKQ